MTTASGAPDPVDGFAQTYAQARQRFFAAAAQADLSVTPHPHPLRGADGEPLALDVVRDGPVDAHALLVISSACHGVEGFCGSGVQVAALGHSGLREAARAAGVAVLYLHALNPHGFSWWRRTTHENVDLNRNFHDFGQPLPVNSAYDALAGLIVPMTWPPAPEVQAETARWIAAHGENAWQAAVTAGQHRHADGLFYGGTGPTWSNLTVRQVLRAHGQLCQRLGWIDLHTGLGPSGHGERILATRDDAAAHRRARAWWGDGVTSIYDGSSTSARLTGMLFGAAYNECSQAEYTGIALEYGTLPTHQVLDALRADQVMHNQAWPEGAARAAVRRQVRDAFYTDTDEWKRRIVEQGLQAIAQAIDGLKG